MATVPSGLKGSASRGTLPAMSTLAEIEKMTPAERLQEMELLWDSLARQPEAVSSPDWHGEVLALRLDKVRRGEATFHSLDEVKRRVGRG